MRLNELKYSTLCLQFQDNTIYQSGMPSLDSTVLAFRDSVALTNIGAFQEVATRSEAGDSTGALALNLAIAASPIDCNEFDRKILNSIYLRTWARGIFEFTPQDSLVLRVIANKSIDFCGLVVYDARVMMRIDLNDYPVNTGSSGNRFIENSTVIEDEVGIMYPNPAGNIAFYEITLNNKESGFIQLYDILGKPIIMQQLNSGFNKALFDLASVSDGVYLYKVIINAEIKTTKKLIITK